MCKYSILDIKTSNLDVVGIDYSDSPASYVSCNNGVSALIATLNLPAGTYIVSANQLWSNATRGGYREITVRKGEYYNSDIIACENNEDNGVTAQYQSVSGILKLLNPSLITMWARQGSGANLSVDASATLRAVRIR